MVMKMWSKWNSPRLLMRIRNGTITLDGTLAAFYCQTNHIYHMTQQVHSLGFYPREMKTYVYTKKLYMDDYCSFINNHQNLERSQMPFKGLINKLLHPYDGITLSYYHAYDTDVSKTVQ